MSFVTVAKAGEIAPGTLKHVEVGETEICIANVEGAFYAVGDRCGHENARMSRGSLMGTIVTCPMHASQFDITTGKLMSGPVLELEGITEKFAGCPESIRKAVGEMFAGIAEEQRLIRTHDLPVYEVKREGSDILVDLNGAH
ncbi:Rieske (2Fe-2S) protein [Methanoregula sp.]|uniref:Rieske (2Fe-2S) protein n=1 Tax=Methanoregula sp. TaxID=2052170 RepID=UPI002C773130|nr:Rieske 2Fe-2S domain-containing protein [Methanoregula sp.]HVP95600.1 Rieske 2Fe-2S domain-containing protein [Methanoregula sp.]